MKNLFLISAIILLSVCKVSAQKIIPAKDAAKHIGEKVTICDKVCSQSNKAFMVTLFLGGDRPNQLLRVAIRFSDRAKTKGYFDTSFEGKDICVTGVVLNGRDGPYIRVNNPEQIKPLLLDSPVKQIQTLN
ncbi:MAG: hypothetical protein JWP37_801 [Mucilaginibacter sp.]|nr:hypothetical protein [Mucilaginibacter sp.]